MKNAKYILKNSVLTSESLFESTEGVKPAAESCYAIKGAIEEAKSLSKKGGGTVVFSLTGNANSLEHI